MREKDIKKCAPFARDDDDESKLRQQLVPLHVFPEFRWWRCENCVQDISVPSASQSQQIVEKATSSLSGGEIHASACGNQKKDDAYVGLTLIPGILFGTKVSLCTINKFRCCCGFLNL